jgi:predicted Zn-dependent protease
MLSNLCKRFPDDPYLWNYLGKLYLDIGKRESAVSAFKTAEEAFNKLLNIPKGVVETNKLFNQYSTHYQ